MLGCALALILVRLFGAEIGELDLRFIKLVGGDYVQILACLLVVAFVYLSFLWHRFKSPPTAGARKIFFASRLAAIFAVLVSIPSDYPVWEIGRLYLAGFFVAGHFASYAIRDIVVASFGIRGKAKSVSHKLPRVSHGAFVVFFRSVFHGAISCVFMLGSIYLIPAEIALWGSVFFVFFALHGFFVKFCVSYFGESQKKFSDVMQEKISNLKWNHDYFDRVSGIRNFFSEWKMTPSKSPKEVQKWMSKMLSDSRENRIVPEKKVAIRVTEDSKIVFDLENDDNHLPIKLFQSFDVCPLKKEILENAYREIIANTPALDTQNQNYLITIVINRAIDNAIKADKSLSDRIDKIRKDLREMSESNESNSRKWELVCMLGAPIDISVEEGNLSIRSQDEIFPIKLCVATTYMVEKEILEKHANQYFSAHSEIAESPSAFAVLLRHALQNGCEEVMQKDLLLEGYDLARCAVEAGNLNALKKAVKDGFDLNKKGIESWTNLMLAVANGHFELVKCLLEAGADPNISNSFNCSALHFAARYDNLPIVAILLEYGAEKECRDFDGNTPLAVASLHGNADVSDFLVSKGSKVSARNNAEKSPVDIAREKGYGKIARMLIKKGNIKNANC